MKRTLFILLLCCALLAGCRNVAVANAPDPTASAVPEPTVASQATYAPAATMDVVIVPPTPSPTPTVSPTPTATPTPEPTPTPTPSPTPEPTPLGILSWTYGDKFTSGETVNTDQQYQSEKVSISIQRISDKERTGKSLVYFVADIYIQDITSLRRAQSSDDFAYGKSDTIQSIAKAHDAILAMSGDFCGYKDKAFIIVDGNVVLNAEKNRYDVCVLYRDGSMEMIPAAQLDKEAVLAKDPWQSWCFGPILLDHGTPPAEPNFPDDISGRHPRAALGYYEPGHYCFVQVDGRQGGYSAGLSVEELTALFQELGCTSAYNLDGGISAQITWNGERINQPGKNRTIRDIVYVAEPQS